MTMEDVNDDTARQNAKSFDEEEEDSSDEGGHLRKRTWEESFALLVAYREKHGNCHVPIRFDADRRLGRWVYSQRLRKDKLTADQIRRLEELGFDDENSDDENDHKTTPPKTNTPSHQEENDDGDEEGASSSALSSYNEELVGFTHTGRKRKAVKRYGITDNDDESDIARRRKETHPEASNDNDSMPPPKPRKSAASPPPPAAAAPYNPPAAPVMEEGVDEDQEDPDYDSAEERRAREKRRKQRQQQAAAANKRGRPKGRPRGRPRKETLEEKLAQIKVGSRVAVLWPAENEYYRATVARIVETRKRPYYLEYDDGETEWLDFAKAQTDFLLLTPRTGPRKRNRTKSSASNRPKSPTNKSSKSNSNRPSIRIGMKVSVYWSDDEQYYDATVVKERKDKNHPHPYKLEYGDGEYEWIDLHQHKFRFLNNSASKGTDLSPVRKSGRRRRLPSRMREDDDESESSSSDDEDEDDDDDDDDDEEIANSRPHVNNNDAEDDHGDPHTKKESHASSSSDESSSTTSSSSSSEEASDIELVSDVRQVELGSRVAVYWSDHERYYEGTVTEHRKGHPMPFFISYDDGDSQYIDLRRRNFCVMKKVRRKKQKREKRRSHSSDSSSDGYHRARPYGTFTSRKRNNRQPQNKYGSRSETASDSSDSTDGDGGFDPSTSVPLRDPRAELDLGTRVTVLCPVRKKYLDGTVTHRQIPRNCRKKLCYYVEYDRGHCEWIELPTRKVRLLKSSDAPNSARKPLKRGRKKVHDSPLLRMLRQKELRKANPDLIHGMEIDQPSPSLEQKQKPEPESSSSSSEESEAPSSSHDSSDESGTEKVEVPNNHLLSQQIGLGSRIAVQCPKELKFMEGSVTRLIRNRRKPFFVEYDIGGFEWIDVHSSVVKILTAEEEKSLKEKSAILVKEEVEIEDEVNIVQPEISEDEKEKKKETAEGDGTEINKETRKAESKPKASVTRRDSLDEDPTPPSPVIPELERKQGESRRSSASKESHAEETLPSLQDEDSSQIATSRTIELQNGNVIPHPATKVPCDKSAITKLSGNLCTDMEISRVSDTEIATVTEKHSPTAVTCVLASTAAQKIVNGVGSKPTFVPGQTAAAKPPNCVVLKEPTNGAVDKAKATSMLDRSSSPAKEVARVAPVAIVSDTSADRHEGADKMRAENNDSNGNKTCSEKDFGEKQPDVLEKNDEDTAEKSDGTVKGAAPEDGAVDESTDTPKKVSEESDAPDTSHIQNGESAKRKRGRPPKNARVTPHKGEDSNDEKKEDNPEAASGTSNHESLDAPRRRGPGRPPKTPPKAAHVSVKTSTTEIDETETPKRRGPGRPPKKAASHSNTVDNNQETPGRPPKKAASHSNTIDNNQETPKKRGPGRPPKSSSSVKAEKAKENPYLQDSDDESSNHAFSKRGPGRPRKSDPEPKKRGPGRPPSKGRKSEPARAGIVDLTSETAKSDVPKKRGPGRPRKNPLPGEEKAPENSGIDGSAQKKRGPGRPRKSESEEPKKRGPGRPRKSPKKEDDVANKSEDIFKTTTVEGARPRKEPKRFSPTQFDDSDSDSSSDGGSPGAMSTPGKKSDFGEEHAKLASQLQVGMRVSVFWGGDKEYYPGTITRARSYRKKKFYLEYDDGEAEWIDFHRNKFKLLSQPKLAAARKRKAGEIDVSDDESAKRRASDSSDTDRSSLIRNRMDMAEVMSKIKIGCRVEVFWSEDDCYYPGTITKQRDNIITSKKPFYLQYDDGESEWIDLRDHVFRLIENDEIVPEKIESSVSAKDKRKREKEAEDVGVKKTKRLKKKKVLD